MEPLLTQALELDAAGGGPGQFQALQGRYRELLERHARDPLLWTRWLCLHVETGAWSRARLTVEWERACEQLGSERHQHTELLHLQLLLRLRGQAFAQTVLDDLPTPQRDWPTMRALQLQREVVRERLRHQARWIPWSRVRRGWWQAGPLMLPEQLEGQPLRSWAPGWLELPRRRGGVALRGQLLDLPRLVAGYPPQLEDVYLLLDADALEEAGPLEQHQRLEVGWYGPDQQQLIRPYWGVWNPDWSDIPAPDLDPGRWRDTVTVPLELV